MDVGLSGFVFLSCMLIQQLCEVPCVVYKLIQMQVPCIVVLCAVLSHPSVALLG